MNVHPYHGTGQIRVSETDNRREPIGSEPERGRARALGVVRPLWTQDGDVKRRTVSLRRLIEVVHLNQRDAGRVAGAADNSGVISRQQCRHDRRFAIVGGSKRAGGYLQLL